MTFATIAALATLTAAPQALAAGHSWQVGHDSVHIELTDLDLQTSAGRSQALARVEKAAVKLCRSNNLQTDRAACEADIIAAATRGPVGTALRTALSERGAQAWAMARPKSPQR
jgi:UrcA family protein